MSDDLASSLARCQRAAAGLLRAIDQLQELRKLVLPQVHRRSPNQFAERGFDRVEGLMRLALVSLEPRTTTTECDMCGHTAVCQQHGRDVLCARCRREQDEAEYAPGDEDRGSRCTTGCGWCGACS